MARKTYNKTYQETWDEWLEKTGHTPESAVAMFCHNESEFLGLIDILSEILIGGSQYEAYQFFYRIARQHGKKAKGTRVNWVKVTKEGDE